MGPYKAWHGSAGYQGPGDYFHSQEEDYPWLIIKLNRRTVIHSVGVGNRKDCCGDRLRMLQVTWTPKLLFSTFFLCLIIEIRWNFEEKILKIFVNPSLGQSNSHRYEINLEEKGYVLLGKSLEQTDRQMRDADRWTDKQTDKQTDRQTDI